MQTFNVIFNFSFQDLGGRSEILLLALLTKDGVYTEAPVGFEGDHSAGRQ